MKQWKGLQFFNKTLIFCFRFNTQRFCADDCLHPICSIKLCKKYFSLLGKAKNKKIEASILFQFKNSIWVSYQTLCLEVPIPHFDLIFSFSTWSAWPSLSTNLFCFLSFWRRYVCFEIDTRPFAHSQAFVGRLRRKQSYKRNLALKKTALVVNSSRMRYFHLYLSAIFLVSKFRQGI